MPLARVVTFTASLVLGVVGVVNAGGCRGRVPPPEVIPPCTSSEACGVGNVCAAGTCQEAPGCLGIDDWPFCREALNDLEPGLGRTAVCNQRSADEFFFACRPACESDDECVADSLCTDFGRCVPGLRRHPVTPTVGPHATLLAGAGEAVLDVPTTTCMGGFSSRAGSGDGRWADGMDAAVGHIEGLWARAAWLDAGDGQLLVVRLPIIFPTQALTEAIAVGVNAETGVDVRDSLLVSATHTHSGPARFLPLLEESEGLLGPFGIGTFRQEVFDRIVKSSVAACVDAMNNAAPARLGWTIAEAFDVDDKIAGDRRSDSPDFDDNRALLVRVDDDAGLPLFVLFSLGVHGTENGSSFATNDVIGGMERAVEAGMFAVAGRIVPALFLQGNAGSMAPTAGSQGFAAPTGDEHAGAMFMQSVGATLLGLETRADVVVRSRAHRFAISSPRIGYAEGEWVNGGSPPFGGEVTYGGMNCFRDVPEDVDVEFDGHLTRADMGCGIAFHTFLFNHPPTVFERSQINAIDLDGLALLTLPGELTMEAAWDIDAELERAHGLSPLATFTLGYSNDHVMYLLPTTLDEDAPPWPGYIGPAPSSYPPFAFSPFRGGYEADTQIWGDLFGDFLKRETVIAWQRLQDRTSADAEVAPAVFTPNIKAPIEIDATPADRRGVVVKDLPGELARRAPVDFTIVGGDVAVEAQGPVFTLRRLPANTEVLLPSGRPFSTLHAQFPVRVDRLGSGEWQWTARLELPADFPAGSYQLRAVGRASVDGSGDNVVDYDVVSAEFTVVGGELAVTARRDGNDVVVEIGWPNAAPAFDDDVITGALSLIDARVPHGRRAPLRAGSLLPEAVVVRGESVSVVGGSVAEELVDGSPLTVVRASDVPAGSFSVVVIDLAGNRGTATLE